jgi:Phosphotransferase enzyme family
MRKCALAGAARTLIPVHREGYRRAMTSIRDRIVLREPFGDSEGASGATLERATLDDGRRVVLKAFDPDLDLTMRVADRRVPVEVDLWRAGVLDRLPPQLGHGILDAWHEDPVWILAMSDLGPELLDYGSIVDRAQCRTILGAAHAMHEAFVGAVIPQALPLDVRVRLFAPEVMRGVGAGGNPLPGWALEGWERFDRIVPSDVSDAVRAIHDRPERITEPLIRLDGATLLHGDYWLPNIAPTADRVVAIDWALATVGPPVLEFASFLVGCGNQVDATHDEVLADLRVIRGPNHDERALHLGLICGLVELGWNLAWHVVEHPDEVNRRTLDWWVEATRRGLATGLLA